MCGIVGALDLVGRRDFSRKRLDAMTRALQHRGPDDAHSHTEPGLAMATRRLSIVDLVLGRQPLSNERGDVWVSVNGELFDYPELSEELRAAGHVLRSRTDSELWVHRYEDVGQEVFRWAKGQFAVALWDRAQRKVLLGRDRAGICPLYYAERDGWLLWASEVKGLLASGLVQAELDAKALDHLFCFFSAPPERSFFEGVRLLPPGHFLDAGDGRVVLHKYWDLEFPCEGEERREKSADALVDEAEALFERAVRRRLRGDVPVVSYLSGGLDSTLLLGTAKGVLGDAPPSFTIGLDRAGPDESSKSAESARLLGSRLTTVTMGRREIAEQYPKLVIAAEGPVVDTSCACLLRLAAEVQRSGHKVALTGEGADEGFAGYVWYRIEKVMNGLGVVSAGVLPRLIRGLSQGFVGGSAPSPPLYTAQSDMHQPFARTRSTLYASSFAERLGAHDPYSELRFDWDKLRTWAPLHRSMYVDHKLMLAGHLLLSKGDRVTMHNSVETRYPYLDEDLVEFASRLAPEYKLRGFREKWLLRRVAERTLPPAIAKRPKSMFRAHMTEVMFGAERPVWVDQLLSAESMHKSGLFEHRAFWRELALQRRLGKSSPRRAVFDYALTAVLATQLFVHTYLGGGLCEIPVWSADTPGSV
jgi:asparagine synthase (glutamine-hydrolysing)